MKTKSIIPIIAALVLFLTPLACSLPGANSPTKTADGAVNVETFAVQLSLTALAGGGTPAAGNPTVAPGDATMIPTSAPTQTVTQTETTIPTVTSTPTNTAIPIPCNAAAFVADVTFPDDSLVTVNKDFVKTWRLKNEGTCPWTSGYRLIYDFGDQMGAPASVSFTGGMVAPGAMVDIPVSLKAPAAVGTYKGYFRLKASDGQVFGIGPSANGPFWVQIKTSSILLLPDLHIQLLPDLKITAIIIDPNPAKAEVAAHIHVKVSNTGGDAIKPFNVGWWGLENFAVTSCGWIVPSLGAGKSETLQCNFTYPSPYALLFSKATADMGGAIAEISEANNTMKVQVSVKP